MRTLFIILLSLLTSRTFCQEYDNVKVYLGLGVAFPGVTGAIEPTYRLNNIELGAKAEFSIVPIERLQGGNKKPGVIASYSGNVKFYGQRGGMYWGFGAGLYKMGFENQSFSKFGFYPRVGISVNRFNINVDYNIIVGIEDDDFSGEPWRLANRNNYNLFTIRFSTVFRQ